MSELKAKNCTTCPSRVDSVFCSLPPNHLEELNRHKTTNRYRRGQTVFYEGNPSIGLFCIGGGKVKLFKSGADGKETILKVLQGGDVLGYWNVLTDQSFTATAEVIEDAEICFVDRKFIAYLVGRDSELAFEIIRRLGGELSETEQRLSDLANQDVRTRFLRLLLALNKTHGKKDANGTYLDIRLSRNELGALVGATPETVIRLLSSLSDDNYVELEGKKIIIKDLAGIAREADLDS